MFQLVYFSMEDNIRWKQRFYNFEKAYLKLKEISKNEKQITEQRFTQISKSISISLKDTKNWIEYFKFIIDYVDENAKLHELNLRMKEINLQFENINLHFMMVLIYQKKIIVLI